MIQIRFEGQTLAELIRQTMEFVSESSGRKAGFVDEGAPAPEAPKPEAPKQDTPKIELADVRAACIAYRDKRGQAALTEIFAKLGAKKLPDIPLDKYGELMEMVK